MGLKVIGAGIPRTGTRSLEEALNLLLNGRTYTLSSIPGHPFHLGDDWNRALHGQTPDWDRVFDGFVSTVSFPGALFWETLSQAYPDARIVLSIRETDEWWNSIDKTILPFVRRAEEGRQGQGILALLERFAGTPDWDDPQIMKAAYERHNERVRQIVPPHRLLEWRPTEGWDPLCQAFGLPVPEAPFPWVNRRREWMGNETLSP